ncbi:MAG: DUF58 domain-containing protein [Thermoproteota archaeon]
MAVRPKPRAFAAAAMTAVLALMALMGLVPEASAAAAILLATLIAAGRGMAEASEAILHSLQVKLEASPRSVGEGQPAWVRVRIYNPTERRIPSLLVKLGSGPRCRLQPNVPVAVSVEPGAESEILFKAVPAPGLHLIGGVELEAVDLLGFFGSVRRLDIRVALSATPAVVEGARLPSALRLHGVEEVFSRLVRGRSTEFYEIREYVPGDDVRRIVWSASARTGRLMVREDLAELTPSLYVFVDLSEPMWVGLPGDSPGDHAMRMALSLALYVGRGSGILGYTVFHGHMWVSRGRLRGSDAVQELVHRFASYDPLLSRPRSALRRALEEAAAMAEAGRIPALVILSGPMLLDDFSAEDLATMLSGYSGYKLLLIIVPSSEVPAGAFSYESRKLEASFDALRRAGVEASVVRGLAGLRAALQALFPAAARMKPARVT